MTATRFDNAMTAHVWAQQTQPHGQSHNGNLYFSGRSIYSYGTHYVAGYVAPGDTYLYNADSSSITTNGKHMPAVRNAIPGQGVPVPRLGAVADIFESLRRGYWNKAEAQKRLAQHFEYLSINWPGVDSAAACFIAAGMTPAKAQAKAEAAANRVERAAKAAKEKAARQELDSNARAAKFTAQNETPRTVAIETRDHLAEAAGAVGTYRKEQAEAEAQEVARELFRQAKAAKVKGWTRIAAHCRACYKAARAELKRYEQGAARFQVRGAMRDAIETIRAEPPTPGTAPAYNETATGLARRNAQHAANFWGERAESLSLIAASCFAGAALPTSRRAAIMAEAERAAELGAAYQARAGALVQEEQAERRADWLNGGRASGYFGGSRLQDSEGGALLRAVKVERDESGAVTGGTLETSWGASVPLVHAIRAFRFLKLCREQAQPWAANGRTIRVGHFTIDRVDAAGNFWAACHRINWQEVERLAGVLGVLGMTAADSALVPSRGAA